MQAATWDRFLQRAQAAWPSTRAVPQPRQQGERSRPVFPSIPLRIAIRLAEYAYFGIATRAPRQCLRTCTRSSSNAQRCSSSAYASRISSSSRIARSVSHQQTGSCRTDGVVKLTTTWRDLPRVTKSGFCACENCSGTEAKTGETFGERTATLVPPNVTPGEVLLRTRGARRLPSSGEVSVRVIVGNALLVRKGDLPRPGEGKGL